MSNTSNTFLSASRLKLRFDSPKGFLGIEDLWDLPLSSGIGKANLDTIAMDLDRQLKSTVGTSFVMKEVKTDEVTQLKFNVVKEIIDIRLTENEAAAKARINREKLQNIMALISAKENEQLSAKSIDELRAEMNNISASLSL